MSGDDRVTLTGPGGRYLGAEGDAELGRLAPVPVPENRDHWWERPFLALDTETTSPDPETARIVQVALLNVYPDGTISENSYGALVNPGVEIPAAATAVHGITTAQVQAMGAPPRDVVHELLRRLQQWSALPLVIYNAPYDWPLLWAEVARQGFTWIEPLAAVRILDPLILERHFRKEYTNTLAEVAKRYDLVPSGALHGARADAALAAQILIAQRQQHPELLELHSLDALQQLQRDWYAAWRDEKNAMWARRGKPHRITGNWPFGR